MAATINAGEVRRGDLWFVDPFQIIVKEELRGRHTPPTEDAILDMAVSIMDNGQQQPVQCRRLPDKRLQLSLGFTRTAAARLIRHGFTDSDGVERKDEEFMLQVKITDANDQQAFVNNVIENAHRNQTSPIDDAHNQHKLRETYGYADAQITKLYRYRDENKVGRLRRLLSLPKEVQQMVHGGTMPVKAALELLDLPDDKRDEAIKAATNESGQVVAAKVTQQVREHILSDQEDQSHAGGNGPADDMPKPRYKPLVLAEVRKFYEGLAESDDAALVEHAKIMLLWIRGQRSNKYVTDHLTALVSKKR
jgi:ParB/RepB/Spo0J family partition protein